MKKIGAIKMNLKKMKCELLAVEGAFNVRDLGGYHGKHGKLSKRRFMRAGSLSSLTKAGRDSVRDMGVDCIIDLRSKMEVHNAPDALAGDDNIAYIHVSMLDYIQSNLADAAPPPIPASLSEMYIGLLENDKHKFAQIMRLFADERYSRILFHCTAGKDRTGLTAMLLLGLAGVDNEVIAEDYSYSEHLLEALREQNADTGLPGYLFASRRETICTAMSHLEQNYGGIVPYLTHIGVDEAVQSAVLGKIFAC